MSDHAPRETGDGHAAGPDPDAGGAAPPAPIEFDIYCPKCAYHLRGLAGDPLLCPECGEANPLGEAEIPAPAITAQLRAIESSLAAGVAALLLALAFPLPMLCVAAWAWFHHSAAAPRGGECVLSCAAIDSAVFVPAWVWGLVRFRTNCRGARGWLWHYIRYQVFAAGLCLLMLGAILGNAEVWRDWRPGPGWEFALFGLAAPAVAVVILVRLLQPLHRWLTAPIHSLQREAATRAVREYSRRRLHRAASQSRSD